MGKGSLLGDLAGKIRNIDGKILGKDGKPMVARRCVHFSDTTKESVCGDVRSANTDSSLVEPASHTVKQPITSDHQKCMVHEVVNRPDLGRTITMVTDPSSHTNDAPIEQNISLVVSLPKDAVDEIKARFVNTLYGFSVGKRLAFPMVENYVKHAWAKFGLKRAMMHHGFFMFQFESKTSMEKVMEGGLWRIQLVPIILKVWMPNTLLQKENVSNVPLWVKMHNVPIVAYSNVGRSEYARAIVEVSAEKPLVDSVDIDILLEDKKGHTIVNIRIDYEWQPPRCYTCKNFDHLESVCPKKLMECPEKKCDIQAAVKKDKRPVQATGMMIKGKQVSTKRYIKGIRVSNPKTKLVYRAVVKPQSDNHVKSNMEQSSDATKKASPPDSLKNGESNYINDEINLDELRNFVDKMMEEESVLEYIRNNAIDGCNLREKQDDKVSFQKPSSSMEVLNEDSNTDEDEVFVSNDGSSLPSSSIGGGQQLEDEILNAYDN
ncbi:zinc knuckle CX2CX4HX4C containing protein [Tanacetum coccineum]